MSKRAVLIGINSYQDPNVSDLAGCVVVLFVGALVCWAWAPETSTETLNEIDGETHQAA